MKKQVSIMIGGDKVKKQVSIMIVFVLLISVSCHFALAKWGENQSSEKEECVLLSKSVPNEVSKYLADSSEMLAESIAVSAGLGQAVVEFGNVVSVLGTEMIYYTPVFVNEECKYLLSMGVTEEGITVSYSERGCSELATLSGGEYYFFADDGCYLVGEKETIEIYPSKSGGKAPEFNSLYVVDCVAVNVFDKMIRVIVNENSTKSIQNKDLSAVPGIGNVGNTCWAACAAAICQYYGNNSVTGDSAHQYAHGTVHTRNQCPGASLATAYSIVHNLTGKTANRNTSSRLNASNALTSINQNKPVLTAWFSPSATIGHAMVITGYQFNNSTGAFTYILMDPNSNAANGRRYLVSTYAANQVSYTSGSATYYWEEAYYDWH